MIFLNGFWFREQFLQGGLVHQIDCARDRCQKVEYVALSVIDQNKGGYVCPKVQQSMYFHSTLGIISGAQRKSARLSEIVVESNVKTSLSKLTLGIRLSEYIRRTRLIRCFPKSPNILQSLRSLARQRDDRFTDSLDPRW